ncbi:hypothetical protein CBR_g19971 [Chara braunii]|uniref:Reverse transcriptase domain-containing protein n=1 Tax=Chara braunii TaxID=69332 RepID=A0A388KZ47_CHABU|nr:hypothetical protein CBR_g19971 [Chara braunii]|eukprot:GBG75337.1 hypothetical protein CBR_g19971 [Chara braunii]
MPAVTRSQTGDMEWKQGEIEEAYEARMLDQLAKWKKRADGATTARRKQEEEAQQQHQLAEEQRRKHNEAAAKVVDEERRLRRDRVFKEERELLELAREWQTEAESQEISNRRLSRFTDLFATYIAQQEDIHCLDDAVDDHKKMVAQLTSPVQLLEQRPTATPADPSNLAEWSTWTQQLLDRYNEAVPIYFTPHACEPVTFDVLDTDFNIILGTPWLASADHTVNFHRQTLTVRDAFGAEVSCTIPLPHPSIRCQVVTAKSFRVTSAYERTDKITLCSLQTVAATESSPTDLSSNTHVLRLLDEFANVFESPTGVLPDRPISHEIILDVGVVPLKGCICRMSEEELVVLHTQLDDLLDKGWIRPSSSPYSAPVLFVRKKNKDLRLCIDYSKLNAQSVENVGPLPHIGDLLERLVGTKYFSKLDLKSGYHQISIRPQDHLKFTFKTPYGNFARVVMPFGLTNAPMIFQAAMTNDFFAMLDRSVLVYLDDILVYSRTLEDHLEHLRHAGGGRWRGGDQRTEATARWPPSREEVAGGKEEMVGGGGGEVGEGGEEMAGGGGEVGGVEARWASGREEVGGGRVEMVGRGREEMVGGGGGEMVGGGGREAGEGGSCVPCSAAAAFHNSLVNLTSLSLTMD